ncbi:unnamed protein product [Peronospora belbahrii]|uniref:Uncharacterized protein n=1 Tax=Peronospora belbahrii TaxID=622444 RepID=A0AAU9KME9_9STRA|nr:unnamed protein product [Peronospora belbahrii]
MTSWAALNVCEGDVRDRNLTTQSSTEEAQDAENALLYEKALRCQQHQQSSQAKAVYLQLLKSDFRLNHRLEYLCHKNVATMEFEAQSFDDALEYFASALALDATDVVVWYQMARTAIETGKLWLARRLLEEGMKVDATYWPLVDLLVLVLHQVGDEDEYERVAKYLRQQDPQCATVRILDKMETLSTTLREKKMLEQARKRQRHFQDIMEREKKRRKQLLRENEVASKSRLKRRQYVLRQASWMGVGKLLLEIFEDINRDKEADVMQTQVQIQAEDNEEMDDKGDREEDKVDQDGEQQPPVLNTEMMTELPQLSTGIETTLSASTADNNTQESGIDARQVTEIQPRRRKSRRHEERLREEHAAAVKKAQEKDLTYRLRAFLPVNAGNEDMEGTLESASTNWPPPLDVKLVDGEFSISNASKEILSKTASFAFTMDSEVSTSNTEPLSSRLLLSDQAVHVVAPQAKCVTERQILSFIDRGNILNDGIIDWVRLYLNQCGQWSHLKLGSEADEIYKVCMWLEKALIGDLYVAQAVASTQYNVINVAEHSLIQNSRFEGNGLSLSAQLFLLELHFDTLLQHRTRGKMRCKIRRHINVQLAEARKLLFAFGWLEDSEDALCCPTGDDFLRLFWLMARMYERCGNHEMAQDYFTKCREKFFDLKEEDGENDDCKFRVDLTNQKADSEITLKILDEKISGLRFSDVCFEARRLFKSGDHDHVLSVLLGHFFPCNQAPRMTDFLKEFEVNEDELLVHGESNKFFEIVLQSLGQSSKFSDEDAFLFLLTTLYYVIDYADGLTVKKELTSSANLPDEACASALTAINFLLGRLVQTPFEHLANVDHRLLLRALCVKCLQPSMLFRFDSPDNVLSTICVLLRVDEDNIFGSCDHGDSTQRMIEVDAMARLLHVILSLSGEKFQNLFTLVPLPAKKKQLRRDCIRVIIVELLRLLNRAFRDDDKIAVSFSLPKRSALMRLCSILMKEEEEITARTDGKMSRQLFGNSAILFLQLYESYSRLDPTTSPTCLVELIHLLHQRLGHYGICGLTYFSDIGSGESHKGSCFLETSTVLLSNLVQKTGMWVMEKPTKKLDEETSIEFNAVEDVLAGEYLFQKETSQCYRCLYDVHILPGCEDHKTRTTFASLQNAKLSARYEDAMRLIRFAVPILLATKAKNNGQKKERLKLLYAVRDALSGSSFSALSAQSATVSPRLEAFLAPRGLLQEEMALPFPFHTTDISTESPDKVCLGHVWYLMGANYILGRAKRRGNLIELMEMEQHVRERVEFLMKDVLYYHPDRVDSWVCLGKTMKELYHAATDAFAAVLGRKLRVQAFQWYTTEILSMDTAQAGNAHGNLDVFSFQNVVLEWNLFQKIKEWQCKDVDGHKLGSTSSTLTDLEEGTKEDDAQRTKAPHSHGTIEKYAAMYIVQVIEFARRCFDMAARLAEEAVKRHGLKSQSKRDNNDNDVGVENAFDLELDELQNKIIECNEECGLLLFNVLQEFSLIKELNLALFPHDVYSRLISKTLAYFQRGWTICESRENAHEGHFRLQYMIGKTLKKRRWCELCQEEKSDPEALSTAKEMADSFSRAESARDKGDREHALVHAFYALQALRIELTICDSSSVSAMRLVCNHFYEKGEQEDDAVVGVDDNVGSASANECDRKNCSDDAAKNTSRKNAALGGTKCASIARKDDILALLAAADRNSSVRELNVALARGWLALNIIKALESIPDEDRYFHPSRYVLARIVYWLSTFCSGLEQHGYRGDSMTAFLDAVRVRQREEKVEGPSVAASRALKQMAPIFDKRRPQIVAIWFSEYIPTAKRFEELNQRQMKYDYYRLKYWRFYIGLLVENGAYGRLKEAGSWVLACKEDHDVIDIMLGIVLEARGKVLRVRLQEMTYTYYLEVLTAQARLRHVMDHKDGVVLLQNAEFAMVTVFLMGGLAFPDKITMVREKRDLVLWNGDFETNVRLIMEAQRHEKTVDLYCMYNEVQGQERVWNVYVDAARSFCEEKWPERSGKGISFLKKPMRSSKATTVTASVTFGPDG